MPHTWINSKWIEHLNLIAKTIKLLEENREEKLHDIRFGNDFLGYDIKSTGNKSKTRQIGLYQNLK